MKTEGVLVSVPCLCISARTRDDVAPRAAYRGGVVVRSRSSLVVAGTLRWEWILRGTPPPRAPAEVFARRRRARAQAAARHDLKLAACRRMYQRHALKTRKDTISYPLACFWFCCLRVSCKYIYIYTLSPGEKCLPPILHTKQVSVYQVSRIT